jgi:general secretion pathway protein D
MAEAREDYDTALADYRQAMEKAPKDLRFRAAYYRIMVNATGVHMVKGRKLLAAGDKNNALLEFMRAAEIDPGNESAQQAISEVKTALGKVPVNTDVVEPRIANKDSDIAGMGAPPVLRAVSNEPLTLKMTEDTKKIYEAIGRAAGVNLLFDPDFQSKRITVDLNNVTLTDALRIVGTISNTFWRPVTANTIFVAANTRTKHTELDEQAVETFYLANAWQPNDLTDVQTALRNVLPQVKVAAVASQNSIVVRGTPDELLLAEKLVNDLDKPRGEVIVDIAVLEVSKNWERNLGLSWPGSISFQLQPLTSSTSTSTGSGTSTGTSTGSGLTLSNLGGLNSNNIAVTVGAATANLLLTDSNTKILQNPRIRSTDAQKATMKIGSRIPIATGSYGTGVGGVGGVGGGSAGLGLVNTQFQYQDVGVNIELTPTVHYDHDVTMKLKIEVTSQSGSVTISGVTEPILSQRTTESVIRLREGEASILGGILNKQDTVSSSGIPGLSQIPLIKYLFGSKDHTIEDDEIVFMLIPHVVRSQDLTPANLRMVDAGVGQNIQLRRTADGSAPTTTEAPAALPAVRPAKSMTGTVPGASAEAAAPNALAQMRREADAVPAPVSDQRPAAAQSAASLKFQLVAPSAPINAGSNFAVPIQINEAQNVMSVPMQISYDPKMVSLINIGMGDLLSKDGQAVAIVHRDDPPGKMYLNVSRPPSASGVTGSGTLCVLRFQAKQAGDAHITITKAAVQDANDKQVEAAGVEAKITIQ